MTDTDPDAKPERWTYLGIRQGKTHTKVYAWLAPDGEELFFAKVKGTIIGGIYEVQVTRGPDGAFDSVQTTATWTGERETGQDKLALWQAENRLTDTMLSRQRAERKAREDDEFREAMEPLRALFARSRRLRSDRAAVIAMIIDELYWTGNRK